MDNLDLRPKIDLKQQPTVTCSECGGKFFKEVVLIKKVPALLTGNKIGRAHV